MSGRNSCKRSVSHCRNARDKKSERSCAMDGSASIRGLAQYFEQEDHEFFDAVNVRLKCDEPFTNSTTSRFQGVPPRLKGGEKPSGIAYCSRDNLLFYSINNPLRESASSSVPEKSTRAKTTVSEKSSAAVTEAVREAVYKILPETKGSESTPMIQLGADSLTLAEVGEEIYSVTGISLSVFDIIEMKTVNSVCKFCGEHVSLKSMESRSRLMP